MEIQKIAPFAILILLLVILFNQYQFYGGGEDDAYISFRYLDNWLQGRGLVFNPGEYVEGYTNFLWIVLMAPVVAIGITPETAAYLLSLLLLASLLLIVYRIGYKLSGDTVAAWSGTLLLASSVTVNRWASSGMETLFVAAVIAYANYYFIKVGRHNYISSALFGLAILIRPDASLFVFSSFLASIISPVYRKKNSFSHFLKQAVVVLVLPVIHLIFRVLYYGEWLPNTFYAKLSGELPGLVTHGLNYLNVYLNTGGWFIVLPCFALLFLRANWNVLIFTIALQISIFTLYVVNVGGDYLAYHRFLVPVIPLLCVLAGISLFSLVKTFKWKPVVLVAVTFILAIGQNWIGLKSTEYQAFQKILQNHEERSLVAEWIKEKYPTDSVIAVNAAGVIPYQTGMMTIDMLGLNDYHIARAKDVKLNTGGSFVGHFKFDGDYVCERQPDVVVISSGILHSGRSREEAITQAVSNTFVSDRAFLKSKNCSNRYIPEAAELLPGKFVVVYKKQSVTQSDSLPENNASAREWFNWGLKQLGKARFQEALHAFERARELDPGDPNVLTNLAYVYFDTKQYQNAIRYFEQALNVKADQYDALYGLALVYEKTGDREKSKDLWKRYIQLAPDSPWKDRAKTRLRLLGGLEK